MKNALIIGMPDSEYHSDPIGVPCLSSSIAHVLVNKSAAHAYHQHPMLGGNRADPTSEMNEGSILDSLLLCGGKGIVTIHADNFRTKAAQEERDAALAAGMTPVIAAKLAEYQLAAAAIAANLDDIGADIYAGDRQVTIFWTETAENGNTVQCKARLDQLLMGPMPIIRDLKKAASAHPLALPKNVVKYGYHIQCAAYLNALAAVSPDTQGVAKFEWMFCEKDAPYNVCIADPSGAMLHFGQSQWIRAVNLWEQCLRTGEWPGYVNRVHLEVPPWAMLEAAMQEEV